MDSLLDPSVETAIISPVPGLAEVHVRLPCVAAIALFAAASAQQPAAPPSPQTPQATFRTGVDLIQLDVVVLDQNRRPVTGLTAGDFSIQLDGKPALIDAFAAITLPRAGTRGGRGRLDA